LLIFWKSADEHYEIFFKSPVAAEGLGRI